MTDVLDLDATPPPRVPPHRRGTITLRVRPSLLAWIRNQAATEGVTINAWIGHTVERAREELPSDVREWLAAQAAQCGCPRDLDQALILTVRHLAKRWPHGGRLK